MDDKLRLLAWIVGGGGFFGLLGGGFGALVGAIHWQAGRASGTAVALRIARILAGSEDDEAGSSIRGALVGAIDGFLFLSVLGMVLGAVGARSAIALQTAGLVALGALLLVGGALFFGGLALVCARSGIPGVAGLFGGATAGGVLGYYLAAATGLMVGVLGGATLGTLGTLAGRHFTSQDHPPGRGTSLSDDPPRSSPHSTWDNQTEE